MNGLLNAWNALWGRPEALQSDGNGALKVRLAGPTDANGNLLVAGTLTASVSVNPLTYAGFISTQTPNPGTGFAAFPDTPCRRLRIVNETGKTLRYATSANPTMWSNQIADKNSADIDGLANASQIFVHRDDNNNAPVTVWAEVWT